MLPSNVIINADDFGLNTQKNLAITKCFQKGLINSTSVMPNMPAFKEAILLAKSNHFGSNIGLHACLTEGKPLTDLSKTSLVNKEGFFIKKNIYNPRVFLSRSIRDHIEKEINAQLEELYITKLLPTHINSHHMIHELPWLLPIFLTIANKHNIKIRVSQIWVNGNNPLKLLYRKIVNKVYKYYRISFTDSFEVLEVYKNTKLKKGNQNKLTEIMVHPDLNEKGEIVDSIDSIDLEKSILNLLNT